MFMNELRRDYFIDRLVIIAVDRARRPTDFVKARPQEAPQSAEGCFFCPGNERLTPPARASYIPENGSLLIKQDTEGQAPFTGWLVRVVPNKFPAVHPEEASIVQDRIMAASGVHEVIIESPLHNKHPQNMTDEEARLLFRAYRDRFDALGRLPFVKYISLFRNFGKDAGASLAHPHSQIITTPLVPQIIREQFGLDYRPVIAEEEKSARLIEASPMSVAFTPFASAFSYEIWVFPRRSCKNISELSEAERDDLAVLTKNVLARLSKLLSDPPYNYCFVQSMSDHLHMHIRIYPKLGIEAGFELNTGININSVPPESAAKSLREVPL